MPFSPQLPAGFWISSRPLWHHAEMRYLVRTPHGVVTVLIGSSGAHTTRALFRPADCRRAPSYSRTMETASNLVRDDMLRYPHSGAHWGER
jgi:hypothetical protein